MSAECETCGNDLPVDLKCRECLYREALVRILADQNDPPGTPAKDIARAALEAGDDVPEIIDGRRDREGNPPAPEDGIKAALRKIEGACDALTSDTDRNLQRVGIIRAQCGNLRMWLYGDPG